MGIPSPNGGSRQQSARRPGRVIPFGKYLLLERIAVGGMAEVYLAKSFGIEGFEKLLAIKRILPTMAEDEDFIDMFIDEAKIAGQLTHANIVPIFELGKIGESHYIAMEYVWGKDLLQIMNRFRRLRKRMPPAMVAWIATKMCEALDYAHNKRDRRGRPLGIIHRDVSPQNILMSYEGEVKIIDFGIAKAASRTTKTQAGVLKGKFGYMSPEQVRGLPVDHRSDIFAVGTCMYEALTSERLFLGESDFSTLEKVRNASVAPVMEVAEVPGALSEIVMTALKRDPGDRFQTAAELQLALQQYLAKQRPPFGTSKLSAWLKTAFAAELAREKARIDSFANVGRPSVLGGRRTPSLERTLDDKPATKRPPPREPATGGGAPPPLPRPAAVNTTDELSDSDLMAEEPEELEGEATMVSASPFEEAMAAGEVEDEEITEEPTQIFFSADDLEEIDDDDANVPAGGIPSDRPGVVSATFRPGEQPRVGAAARPASPAAPPKPAPMPPPARSMGNVGAAGPAPEPARPDRGAFASPPPPAPDGSPQSMKPEATPVFEQPPDRGQRGQRHVPTMELNAGEREAAIRLAQQQRKGKGKGRTVLVAALASVVMLAVGVVAALIIFGGDDVGTVEVRTTPSVGAAVVIDGIQRGRAPLRVERIKAGERTLEIQADGYETATRTITVSPDSVAMLEIALQPAAASPPTQVASAESAEEEAAAEEEATAEEGTTAAEEEAAEEGAAEEETAEASGEAAEEEEAAGDETTEAEQETRVAQAERAERRRRAAEQQGGGGEQQQQQQRRARAGAGTLVIMSIPWARVFIDGRDTQRNTPIPGIRVRSGTRTVGLRTPDGEMHNFQVEVPAGETVRLTKRL